MHVDVEHENVLTYMLTSQCCVTVEYSSHLIIKGKSSTMISQFLQITATINDFLKIKKTIVLLAPFI